MKNRIFLASILIGSMVLGSATLFAQDAQNDHGSPEPRMAGVQWARGEAPPNGQAGSSPDMTYHGGPVMNAGTAVQAIFWGSSWNNSSVAEKINGMDTFYTGIGGSSYANTNSEYTDGTGRVNTSVAYGGHYIDTSSAPKNANVTTPILNEVCKVLGSNVVANAYYPVYVDTKRGHAGFCAWHSAGSCGGVPVQFGFFFNLDGDSGCDPGTPYYGHSQGVAALANVSGHEISEMMTDPRLNAWYDSSGAENADKCAWTFSGTAITFKDAATTQWKIQGNWSNAAYDAGKGYVRGCIDGN